MQEVLRKHIAEAISRSSGGSLGGLGGLGGLVSGSDDSKVDEEAVLGFNLNHAFKNYPHYHNILTQKGFWRSWLRDMPRYCASDTPVSACAPTCSNSADKATIGATL